LINQEDSAAVRGEEILPDNRAGNRRRVESFSGIANHNQHPARFVARHTALHFLRRVFFTPVHHGVRQCLEERHFDNALFSGSAVHGLDDFHDVLDKGRNRLDTAFEGPLQLQDQLLAFEFASRKRVCHEGSLQPFARVLSCLARRSISPASL
jgi:hypothetical protein